MKHINIPIPEAILGEITKTLKDLVTPCPKHREEHAKHVMAVDDCQQGLLQAIERIGFGDILITVEDGRPTVLRVTQSLKFGKDAIERLGWMVADGGTGQEKKIVPFEKPR